MEKALKGAAARGVPLTFIRTPDQPTAAARIAAAFDGGTTARPVVIHDPVRGLTAGNKAGKVALEETLDPDQLASYTDPMTTLGEAAPKFPERTVLVAIGADRWLSEARPAIAALLIRDVFKAKSRMLAALGTTYAPAPELGADVIAIDDPAPGEDERREIIGRVTAAVKQNQKDFDCPADVGNLLLTYTRGLSSFATEQTVSLATRKTGYDVEVAERVWRDQINATPGLRVMTERPTPESVAGLASWTRHVQRIGNGRRKPDVIVFVDEIEKCLSGAGSNGDSSGATQQIFGRILTHMESSGAEGSILVGCPGGGKSLAAGAAGAALGIPTIACNPSDAKGSLVGESERNASRMLATIAALGGRAYWIATSNGVSSLPPELLRRFTDGLWMFDLPSEDERTAIWNVHLRKYGLDPAERWTRDRGWTGADIRNVVRAAWNANVPIAEIAEHHVPSSRASAMMIEKLRQAANGAYRSAQYPGAYKLPVEPSSNAGTGRRFDLESEEK